MKQIRSALFLSRSGLVSVVLTFVAISVFPSFGFDRLEVETENSEIHKRSSQMDIPCVVSLKKGRKLVIRDRNGKRLSATLPNGTKVTAVEMADGDGPGAAEIAVERKGKQVILGWVSQADLRCKYD